MALNIQRVDVWAVSLEDRVGGLAGKLAPLAAAGANLGFALARRAPEHPGTGVLFVTPLKGATQIRAAKAAGFLKTHSLPSLRVEGRDSPGLGAAMTKALAGARIDLRGLSAVTLGRRFVAYFAFDAKKAALKAARVLRRL